MNRRIRRVDRNAAYFPQAHERIRGMPEHGVLRLKDRVRFPGRDYGEPLWSRIARGVGAQEMVWVTDAV